MSSSISQRGSDCRTYEASHVDEGDIKCVSHHGFMLNVCTFSTVNLFYGVAMLCLSFGQKRYFVKLRRHGYSNNHVVQVRGCSWLRSSINQTSLSCFKVRFFVDPSVLPRPPADAPL